MGITQYTTATISEHFVCPIEYSDTTGLEDDDTELLNTWLADNVKPNTCFIYSESTSFSRCEITGLMSACVDVELIA